MRYFLQKTGQLQLLLFHAPPQIIAIRFTILQLFFYLSATHAKYSFLTQTETQSIRKTDHTEDRKMRLMTALAIIAGSISLWTPAGSAQELGAPSGIEMMAAKERAQKLVIVIRKKPSDLATRRQLVQALLQAGFAERAAVEMQGLVKCGLRSADDFCLLGDAYRFAGKVTSAISNYMEAINISPYHAHAKAGLAICYMSAGHAKTGEKVCKDALATIRDVNGRKELFNTLKTIKDNELQASMERLAAANQKMDI